MTPTARQEDQKPNPGPERFGDIARRVLADLAAHPSPEEPMRSAKPMPDPADAPGCPDVPTGPPGASTALSGGRTGPSWSTADVDAAAAPGAEVAEQWGARMWSDHHPVEPHDNPFIDRESAQAHVDYHRRHREQDPRWGLHAVLVRRQVWTGPWVPVNTEEATDAG